MLRGQFFCASVAPVNQSMKLQTPNDERGRRTRQTTLTGNSQQIAIQQCNAVSASSKCEKALSAVGN